ncbi:hypothetical protein RvY_06389 [Ramazzottius varieornatus]|uniref:Uncharacterized protein n=1 Tax=Ramazzottius varieornatus TaxID=947166 RepID=A0A1D1V4S2_RAMVA|nr:hypothetical protein RvY_06389 [Ramazzottius varieornatus]
MDTFGIALFAFVMVMVLADGVLGNWLALLYGVAPHNFLAVNPMLKGIEHSAIRDNFMTVDQVIAKMVEYAQEIYNMVENRCDVQKRSLMDDHFMYKIAAGALVAALVLTVCAFAVTVAFRGPPPYPEPSSDPEPSSAPEDYPFIISFTLTVLCPIPLL